MSTATYESSKMTYEIDEIKTLKYYIDNKVETKRPISLHIFESGFRSNKMCNSDNFVVHVVQVNQCGTVHTHMWPASSFVWCSSSFLPLPLHSLCLAFVSGKLAGGWFMLCVCAAPLEEFLVPF